MPRKVAALFVSHRGPYMGMSGVESWCAEADARNYAGPHPVVAHPPCSRWGNFWHGASATTLPTRLLGDDCGKFLSALLFARCYGGVVEHPRGSRAWPWHGLLAPHGIGEWSSAGDGIGSVACVSQGAYGHRAEKLTWLYAARVELPALRFSADRPTMPVERMGRRERELTPAPFADLLVSIARTSHAA